MAFIGPSVLVAVGAEHWRRTAETLGFLGMITQKTRYALRSLLFLAEERGGAPVQLARIAETQHSLPKRSGGASRRRSGCRQNILSSSCST